MWRISEEGNTGTRQKKKTTALRLLLFCVDFISKEFVGFSPFYGFPDKKHCGHCLLCLIVVLVILSVKILT